MTGHFADASAFLYLHTQHVLESVQSTQPFLKELVCSESCVILGLTRPVEVLTSFGRQTNHYCVTVVNIHRIAFTRPPAVLTANFYCHEHYHVGARSLYVFLHTKAKGVPLLPLLFRLPACCVFLVVNYCYIIPLTNKTSATFRCQCKNNISIAQFTTCSHHCV